MAKGVLIGGRFHVERTLGKGGMGETFLATDQLLGRRVVIKQPNSPDMVDWFVKEAKAQACLNHTNAVKLFDFGLDSGRPYIVMEWVAGWDLNRLIECGGRFSPERASYIITAIGQAVAHAHVCGIIHRDIKPHNILIGSDDIPRLADFGIAKLPAFPMTKDGIGIGTPGFAAPEQIENAKGVDFRADVFALGMTLLAMLSGQAWPEKSDFLKVPEEFRKTIYRCLEEKPKNRFPSVEAFLESLPPFRRPIRPAVNLVGTKQGLAVMRKLGLTPARKTDHVELMFQLGEVRVSGKGKTRTIIGYCHSAKKGAGYVIRMHEEKMLDVKRATKALNEYSPSVRIDDQVVESLLPYSGSDS